MELRTGPEFSFIQPADLMELRTAPEFSFIQPAEVRTPNVSKAPHWAKCFSSPYGSDGLQDCTTGFWSPYEGPTVTDILHTTADWMERRSEPLIASFGLNM